MAIQPPLTDAVRYPFTAVIAIAAIAVSVNWWTGGHWADPLFMPHDLATQPWTILSSAIPHVNPVHLLFNLSWWWPLGAMVERVWGGPKAALVFIVLAALSATAEFAFLEGGVGLSGVVYGLATLLWVVQTRDPRFGHPITVQTMKLLGAWFVICIVLTVTGVMPIANIAHGVGALAGWLLGKCIVARQPQKRAAWIAALVLAAAVFGVGATVARQHVNFSAAFRDKGSQGAVALSEQRYAEAVPLLESALAERPDDVSVLIGLGIAYQQTGRDAEAVPLYVRAVAVDASQHSNVAPSISEICNAEADKACKAGDVERAREFAKQSLKWKPGDEYALKVLEWVAGMERQTEPASTEPK